MKRLGKSLLIVAMTAGSGVALAQSSVTLYGVIDNGFNYVSNQGGNNLYQAFSGALSGSRIGFRGTEDLGGGLRTVFALENGFNSFNGKMGQGGLLFGRQAYVGISSDRLGTVTFGRQYDLIVDNVEPFTSNGAYGGWLFAHPVDVDNTDNGFRIDNAAKYVSPSLHGLILSALYSLGGVAGEFSRNSVWSIGARYNGGPISAGAAYLVIKNPETAIVSYQNSSGYVNTVYGKYLAAASSQNIGGVGASYDAGPVKLLLSYTNTTFEHGDNGANVKFDDYELAAGYRPTPAWVLSGGYTYTVGKDEYTDKKPRYGQINLMADYFLSKRTDLYVQYTMQRAWGDAAVAQNAVYSASSTNEQSIARIGLRHKF